MPELPLPYKSEAFSSEGFERLYETIRKDPAAAKLIGDEIEANPKRVLTHAFELTKAQQALIDSASDRDLIAQARVLLRELRAEKPGAVRVFSPTATPDFVPPRGPEWFSCSCVITGVGGAN